MGKVNIVAWNVNGIRASVKKGFIDIVKDFNADFFLVQETKATVEIVKDIGAQIDGYYCYANEADKKGYSGTAIFSKEKAISELYGFNIEEHDGEGRINCIEYASFYLINVYVPNSGSGLKRLDYRKKWDIDFLKFIKQLEKKKPVIVGGDFNVAHEEIDLARPKSNYNKTSGYTQIEIDGMSSFLSNGLFDSFRYLHPETVAYSFWSQRFKARDRNVGWRLDYFLGSEKLKENLEDAKIYNDVMGSDHCPIGIELSI